MKIFAFFIAAFGCFLSLNVKAQSEVDPEGSYQVGHCERSAVMSRQSTMEYLKDKIPLVVSEAPAKCCQDTVVNACSQTFEQMAQSVAEVPNSEDWALCMRAVSISLATAKSPLPPLNTCKSMSCQRWAEDCRDVGLSDLRSRFKSEYPR